MSFTDPILNERLVADGFARRHLSLGLFHIF